MIRIGIMANTSREVSPTIGPTLKRLAELGYAEGKNIVIEYRESGGVTERVVQQARELLRLKVDLILTMGPVPPVRALIAEKAEVPVVFCAVDFDPVDSRIVSSYNHPGGNYTGAYIPQPTLAAKRFELARELLPAAKRFLVFYDAFCEDQFTALTQTASKTSIAIERMNFRAPPYDYAAAFIQGRRAQGFICLMSPLFYRDRAKIAALALQERLPAIGGINAFTEAGFLASYGAPIAKVAERTGEIAARILKGAKPADTPVEQVNEFEFAVNNKTAKALGIKIPPVVLVRADKVIE